MRVINGTGVNDLYMVGLKMLADSAELEQTRNGPAYVMPCPVTSVYHKPDQRVLLNRKRNANPFFHLYESLWMLHGRDDAASLNNFIKDFGERFSNDGIVHGAYGHRWREAMGFDQLESIVERLRANSQDRQCVLQMWDGRHSGCRAGECDVRYGSNDLLGDWKDRPCNTHIYFRVRTSHSLLADEHHGRPVLDMTICCRSNDVIFGAYGANAVHFSVLMEYMAGRIGVELGTMYQISNNYHGYVASLPGLHDVLNTPLYYGNVVEALPMGNNWNRWDEDLHQFMSWHKTLLEKGVPANTLYSNTWFKQVAEPMFIAHEYWRQGLKDRARVITDQIAATDWRMAANHWFDARSK